MGSTMGSQLTGRSSPSLIFPLVSLSNEFSITPASLDVLFLSFHDALDH